MIVDFAFDVGDKVTLPHQASGIIIMVAKDKEGIQYYVQTMNVGKWFGEELLLPDDS